MADIIEYEDEYEEDEYDEGEPFDDVIEGVKHYDWGFVEFFKDKVNKRFYYQNCRELFMGTLFDPKAKYYLHPDPHVKSAARDDTYSRCENPIEYFTAMREFAFDLWVNFFSKLEGWNSLIKKDKIGIYYDNPNAAAPAHFFLGVLKSRDKINAKLHNKPMKLWNSKEFLTALKIGHLENDSKTKDEGTLARFCVIFSCAQELWYKPTTDFLKVKKGCKILIPTEIKPLLDKRDFDWFSKNGITTDMIEEVPVIFDEFTDSRIKFQQTSGGIFKITNGRLVQVEA